MGRPQRQKICERLFGNDTRNAHAAVVQPGNIKTQPDISLLRRHSKLMEERRALWYRRPAHDHAVLELLLVSLYDRTYYSCGVLHLRATHSNDLLACFCGNQEPNQE